MNWAGEDWLIFGAVALWLALIGLWLWRWRALRRVERDEHEAGGIGAIIHEPSNVTRSTPFRAAVKK